MAQFYYQLSGLSSFMCSSHAVQIPTTQNVHVTLVQYDPLGQVTPDLRYVLQQVNVNGTNGNQFYPATVDHTYKDTDGGIDWYNVMPGTYYLYIANEGQAAEGGFNVNGYVNTSISGTVGGNPLTTCVYLG